MAKADLNKDEELEVASAPEVVTTPDDGLNECEVHTCSHENDSLMDDFYREAAGLPVDNKPKHSHPSNENRVQDLRGEEVTVAAELANQAAQRAMQTAQAVAAAANGPVTGSMATVLSALHSVTREDVTDRRVVEQEGDADRLEQLKKRNSERTRETVEENQGPGDIVDVLSMMDGAEHERLNRPSDNTDEEVSVTTTASSLMEGTETNIANTEMGIQVSQLALDHVRRNIANADLATRESEFFDLIDEMELDAQLDEQLIKDLKEFYFEEYHRIAISEGTQELQELAMQHALSGANPKEVMDIIKAVAARVELSEEQQQALLRAYGGAFNEATM